MICNAVSIAKDKNGHPIYVGTRIKAIRTINFLKANDRPVQDGYTKLSSRIEHVRGVVVYDNKDMAYKIDIGERMIGFSSLSELESV